MNHTPAWRQRPGTAPGRTDFLIQEPAEVYHGKAREFLSSHQLADFRESPLLFRKRQLGLIPNEDRPAFLVGRAAHTLVLEGRDEYERRYAIGGPVNPKTGAFYGTKTKAYEEWTQRQGKPVLTEEQAILADTLCASVRSHAFASDLLADGVAEGVLRCDYRGISCQGRLDWLNPAKGLVDLKTCDHLRFLEADARRFGYVHQLAFYRSLLALVTGELVPVFLIAVEKRQPFRTGVWRIEHDVLAVAQHDNEAAMERLVRCRQTDHWPTGFEELRVFDHV